MELKLVIQIFFKNCEICFSFRVDAGAHQLKYNWETLPRRLDRMNASDNYIPKNLQGNASIQIAPSNL